MHTHSPVCELAPEPALTEIESCELQLINCPLIYYPPLSLSHFNLVRLFHRLTLSFTPCPSSPATDSLFHVVALAHLCLERNKKKSSHPRRATKRLTSRPTPQNSTNHLSSPRLCSDIILTSSCSCMHDHDPHDPEMRVVRSHDSDSHRLPLNHRQKIFPNGTLSISDVERSADEGRYTCTAVADSDSSARPSASPATSSAVTSSAGSASSSFFLSVLVRPVIDPFSFPKSLQQGQRYTILCSVSQGDLPVAMQWFKDGRLISSASGLLPDLAGVGVIHVSPFASNLVFESLRPEHRGNYSCRAS